MSGYQRKVAVVGCGNVGAMAACQMVMAGICDELALIDRNSDLAWAQAEDLGHALAVTGSHVRVSQGGYETCRDADVVVLTASAPQAPGSSRLDQIHKTKAVMNDIIPQIMDSGFSGILLVVSNPVDIMADYVQRLSGLPAARVIGTGTILDSARLRYYLAKQMKLDSHSIQAVCVGEHGNSQVALWSVASAGGKSISHILKDNQERLNEEMLRETARIAKESGNQIMQKKGSTSFGIAAVITQLVKAILMDENKILPVSARLAGNYAQIAAGGDGGGMKNQPGDGEKLETQRESRKEGEDLVEKEENERVENEIEEKEKESCEQEDEIYAGIPAVINWEGIQELVEYHMTCDETGAFVKSVEVLRQVKKKIDED